MGKKSTAAKNRWNDKTYDRINLTVPKGEKEHIKAHAEKRGESVNGFIQRAIKQTIEDDNYELGNIQQGDTMATSKAQQKATMKYT